MIDAIAKTFVLRTLQNVVGVDQYKSHSTHSIVTPVTDNQHSVVNVVPGATETVGSLQLVVQIEFQVWSSI